MASTDRSSVCLCVPRGSLCAESHLYCDCIVQGVIDDIPMLHVLEQSSEQVFVPLTVGGGIRGYTEPSGKRI
jgi:hypothetical protein